MKKKRIIVLLLLLSCCILVFSLLVYSQNAKDNASDNKANQLSTQPLVTTTNSPPPAVKTVPPTSLPSSTPSATMKENTYQDENFHILYPPQWQVTQLSGQQAFTDGTSKIFIIHVQTNANGKVPIKYILTNSIGSWKSMSKDSQDETIVSTKIINKLQWQQASASGIDPTLNKPVQIMYMITMNPDKRGMFAVVCLQAEKSIFTYVYNTAFYPMLKSFSFNS